MFHVFGIPYIHGYEPKMEGNTKGDFGGGVEKRRNQSMLSLLPRPIQCMESDSRTSVIARGCDIQMRHRNKKETVVRSYERCACIYTI